MFSHKTRYALMACTLLAKEYGNGPIAIGKIAEQEHIPQRFLEGILLQLKRRGVLVSERGKIGGYALAQPPATITIDQIVLECENGLLIECLSGDASKTCEFAKEINACHLRSIYSNIYSEYVAILRKYTLADLAGKK